MAATKVRNRINARLGVPERVRENYDSVIRVRYVSIIRIRYLTIGVSPNYKCLCTRNEETACLVIGLRNFVRRHYLCDTTKYLVAHTFEIACRVCTVRMFRAYPNSGYRSLRLIGQLLRAVKD